MVKDFNREAVILVGGLGTRLKSTISDLPKPMAPVAGKPFLCFILEYLNNQGMKKVILSAGYKHEIIKNYFGNRYKGISLDYSIEEKPLGTGGAVKKALKKVAGDKIFILNGDTFFNTDFARMENIHLTQNSHLTLSLKPMKNFSRYGNVIIKGSRVVKFEEKKEVADGLINGGIYLANIGIFSELELPDRFSFENDFLEKYVNRFNFNARIFNEYFIDIGTPEDYIRAQKELPQHINCKL